jgi:hypothetical protein
MCCPIVVGRDPAAAGGTPSTIPTGRYYLRSHETHLYVHPHWGLAERNNQWVVFDPDFAEDTRLTWELERSESSDNNYIRSVENREMYWHPLDGHASSDGVPFVLYSDRY